MQIDGQVLAALEAYAKGGARAVDLATVLTRARYRLFDDAERLQFRRLDDRIDRLLTNDDAQSRRNILALLTELNGQYPAAAQPEEA